MDDNTSCLTILDNVLDVLDKTFHDGNLLIPLKALG